MLDCLDRGSVVARIGFSVSAEKVIITGLAGKKVRFSGQPSHVFPHHHLTGARIRTGFAPTQARTIVRTDPCEPGNLKLYV
jgi:hypothetical protein